MKNMKIKNAILKKILLTPILLFTILISCAQEKIENNKTNSHSQKIDALVNLYVKSKRFNGSILVAQNGKVLHKKGYGLANMEWNISNTTKTKFRLGSITKQFTSLAILQLVAKNKLELNKPISTYLPDYPKEKGDLITIHHLLTHSSGIPSFTSFKEYWDIERDYHQPKKMVSLFADSTLRFTPGTKFDYSNSGYFLLGYIIEKITGETYDEYIQKNIFEPLNMVNSGYDHHYSVLKNRASGYKLNQLTREFENDNFINMSVPFSAGALYSTVEDLYLWDSALYSEKILPKKYKDLLFKKHILSDSETYHYGYGWNLFDYPIGNTGEESPAISHDGGINGFTSLIVRFPETKSLIVILNNIGPSPNNEIAKAINGIINNKTYDFPKKSLAHSLREVVLEKGIDKGVSFFKDNVKSSKFYTNENEFNTTGYYFLTEGNLEAAKQVFKFNTELYPSSFNTYDSYAESLMNLKLYDEAIKNYKKSLELNPDNKNAIEMIRKIENK